MTIIQCFMLTPTDRVKRFLRRYVVNDDNKCSVNGYGFHSAAVQIEDGPAIINEDGGISTDPSHWPQTDPRWPKECACGYVFNNLDHWQLFFNLIYAAPDGQEYTLKEAPPGAMFYSDWFKPNWVGPDGESLSVQLPDGHAWAIDGPSKKGGRWVRTGVPPQITVTPSILVEGKYHGNLIDGKLVECAL